MEKQYKVLLAHPGRQHSYQSAIALKKAGVDLTYVTTVYHKARSLTDFVTKRFLHEDNQKRAESRSCSELEDSQVVQFCELRGLITLLLLRLDKSKKIYRAWNNYVFRCFGRKVAKYAIRHHFDMVIMYDATAKHCFSYLSRVGSPIKKVLDVSIAVRPYQRVVYEKDMESTGLLGVKQEQSFLWEKSAKKYADEIALADYFLYPSEFVRESLTFCGAVDHQLVKVPYGVELKRFAYTPRTRHDGPLRMVVAGQINYRKGMHHLFRVMERFSEDEIHMTVFGLCPGNDPYLTKSSVKKNVDLRGFVLQNEIIEEYKHSDLYMFPSLVEGLSLSVLEAMACGLPVLVSDHSGANDLVEDGKNGLVFEAGDDDALERSLRWFLQNRDRLPQMGAAAHETVLDFSWDAYYDRYGRAVLDLLCKE